MAEEKAIKDMTEAEAKAYAGKLEKDLAAKDKELNKTTDKATKDLAAKDKELEAKEKELTETKQLNTELSDQVATLEKRITTGSDVVEFKHKGKNYRALILQFNFKGKVYKAADLAKQKDSAVVQAILDLEGQNIFVQVD